MELANHKLFPEMDKYIEDLDPHVWQAIIMPTNPATLSTGYNNIIRTTSHVCVLLQLLASIDNWGEPHTSDINYYITIYI